MYQQQQAAMARLIRDLERRFGPGVIYRLSQARPKVDTVALVTGSSSLDQATGIGGLPRGRIAELFGPPSCGKTTIAYHLLANAQAEGGIAAFIDIAQTIDGETMLAVGVNLDDLIVATPIDVKEALEIAEILVRCHALDALVLATITSLHSVSSSAQIAEGLRKINTALQGSATAMVFVDEGTNLFPLPFYASLRIAFTPLSALRRSDGDVVGMRVQATVVKNKLSPPWGKAEFIIQSGGRIIENDPPRPTASQIEQVPSHVLL